jgi:omega-hydroxy-beta-dihydromenaquinone-9 sulfotransferase
VHSYILTGIRMGPLVRLLRKHGFTPSPKNIGRLIYIFQNALWSTILTWRENNRYGEKLKSMPVPDDPLIIIGHWRTGTTYLHHLLSLDDQFISPTLFQCSFPESFIAGEPFYRPVMGALVKKRPMDSMKMGFDDAQEDEFAWVKLAPGSPMLEIIFPQKQGYFIKYMKDFIPVDESKAIWKEQMQRFSIKICRDSGKTLLLKNPFHSLRIPFLCEVFPHARFIHIHRHPYNVVASSLNLWNVMAKDNQLKGKPNIPVLEDVVEGLVKFYSIIRRDLAGLDPKRHCEVRYEALEANPIEEIKKIYRSLGLDLSETSEGKMRIYLEKVKDFRKNSYTFDDVQKDRVSQLMKEQFEQYHYKA